MSALTILQTIQGHDDLKNLNPQAREQLCGEIRDFLVEHVAKTGGHLASNLGVVELSVALETVFDTAKDRLVFDVGHQSYIHKLLTGRQAGFDRLRQFDGMAGFPKPGESNTDAFVAGHASSSVSIALGMARARTLMNEKYANYQHLVTDFAPEMLEAVKAKDSSKHGEFKSTSGYFKRFDETVTLTGALSLNVELTCTNTKYTEVGMLIWSEDDYQNATTLTWDNATAIATTTTVGSTSAKLSYTGIAAKDIGKTVYACGYMVVDGNYYYSGVFTTSIEKYASTAINGSGTAADLKSLMKALAVYSEYAKNYFA